MGKMDFLKDQQFVFGSMHIIANRKETLMEREMRDFDITFKQWFLMAIIKNSFDAPPTLNEAARAMGSSHQNIKKIASNLETKGYVAFEKDKRDSRVTRIRLTGESEKFAENIQSRAERFTSDLFEGITEDEMSKARIVLQAMMANLTKMEQKEMEK